MRNLVILFLLYLITVESCWAHGRMESPAARNAMWRHGFNTPANYNDCELNCGGFGQQHLKFEGTCGVCGDSMSSSPRQHEVGGKYATGRIAAYYPVGSVIDIHILLTANHIGYMEFRLCPVNSPTVEATHECLNRNLLPIVGHGTRYRVRGDDRDVYLSVKLPDGLTCSQCVLQWKYRAGNNWGTENGFSGLGYGAQEEFYNCADIAIEGSDGGYSTTEKSTSTTTKSSSTSTVKVTPPPPPPTTTSAKVSSTPIVQSSKTSPPIATLTSFDYRDPRFILCEVVNEWKKFDGMLDFCIKVCMDTERDCPTKFCKCHGINAWLG